VPFSGWFPFSQVTRPSFPRTAEPLVRAGFVLGSVVVGIPALLTVLGFDAVPAMLALFRGSVGSGYAIASGTLVRATPVILTGLAVAIAFRAGVFNIGAEGQLLAGAAAAAAVTLLPKVGASYASAWIALFAGAGAGAAWAGIAALLRARFRVLEVISTILLNFVALDLVGYLVRGPLQEPLHIYPQSPTIAPAARLPRILPGSRLHTGFIIALGAAGVAWWVMRYTAAGFRLRAVGANADAARVAGQIDVARTTSRAFILSGALAGLAGAIELTGVTFALYENISPGYGYTGIAVALLARLDPLGVVASGLLFGALEAGASAMQRDAGVPSVVVSIVEALVILGLIVAWPLEMGSSTRRTTSPAPVGPGEAGPSA
jgi:general nucleoside transport system permease protein